MSSETGYVGNVLNGIGAIAQMLLFIGIVAAVKRIIDEIRRK